jgi:hypothetical protein
VHVPVDESNIEQADVAKDEIDLAGLEESRQEEGR